MHSRVKPFNYHGVVFGDAAGYFVYLPIWFIYGNEPTKWPQDIDSLTGNGFTLDNNSGSIKTKYFSGPALLQTPFFLSVHLLQIITGKPANGFTIPYIYAVIIASVFYVWCGLFMLYKLLQKRVSIKATIATILIIFIGTNLYYYTITTNGMSHAYSFFLFCLLLYLINAKLKLAYKLFFSGLTVSLILLCRPVNIIFIPVIVFFGTNSLMELKSKISKLVLLRKQILYFFVGFILMMLPQAFYMLDTYDSLLTYTYTGESFSNWMHPELIKVWFSTNNGLFTYTPLMAIILVGIILNYRIRKSESMFSGLIFIVLSFICASWWNWWFGCSYGARSFTEYYSLFAFPLAHLITSKQVLAFKSLLWICIIVCIALNLNIIYYYDGCFYGGEWDWEAYWKLHK